MACNRVKQIEGVALRLEKSPRASEDSVNMAQESTLDTKEDYQSIYDDQDQSKMDLGLTERPNPER